MRRILLVTAILVGMVTLAGGCRTAKKASAPAATGADARRSAEWMIQCDQCGKQYAYGKYSKEVPLYEHREWANTQGNVPLTVDGWTYDFCCPECKAAFMKAKGIESETP